MINPPPPAIPEEQLLAADPAQSPADGAPPAPPTPPPAEAPPPAGPPPPDPVVQQSMEAQQRLAQAGQHLQQQYQQVDQQERAARGQIDLIRQQVQLGQLSPEQAAPMEAQYQRGYEQRAAAAHQIQQGAAELHGIAQQVGMELQLEQYRQSLEPFAKKTGIEMLADEAAEKSGDPAGFPKDRLKRLLGRTSPATWRELQAQAIEDYREQRLTDRAAVGTDEMGGTGTGAALPSSASAIDDIAAGLRQMYSR